MSDLGDTSFREGLAFIAPLVERSALYPRMEDLQDRIEMILAQRGVHSSTHGKG